MDIHDLRKKYLENKTNKQTIPQHIQNPIIDVSCSRKQLLEVIAKCERLNPDSVSEDDVIVSSSEVMSERLLQEYKIRISAGELDSLFLYRDLIDLILKKKVLVSVDSTSSVNSNNASCSSSNEVSLFNDSVKQIQGIVITKVSPILLYDGVECFGNTLLNGRIRFSAFCAIVSPSGNVSIGRQNGISVFDYDRYLAYNSADQLFKGGKVGIILTDIPLSNIEVNSVVYDYREYQKSLGNVFVGCDSKGFPIYAKPIPKGTPFRMTIEDVFAVEGRGIVITGTISSGEIRTGNAIFIDSGITCFEVSIIGIEMYRMILPYAQEGDNVGILISGVGAEIINRGMIATSIRTESFLNNYQ